MRPFGVSLLCPLDPVCQPVGRPGAEHVTRGVRAEWTTILLLLNGRDKVGSSAELRTVAGGGACIAVIGRATGRRLGESPPS